MRRLRSFFSYSPVRCSTVSSWALLLRKFSYISFICSNWRLCSRSSFKESTLPGSSTQSWINWSILFSGLNAIIFNSLERYLDASHRSPSARSTCSTPRSFPRNSADLSFSPRTASSFFGVNRILFPSVDVKLISSIRASRQMNQLLLHAISLSDSIHTPATRNDCSSGDQNSMAI